METYILEVGERAAVHTDGLDEADEDRAIAFLFPAFEGMFCHICGRSNH